MHEQSSEGCNRLCEKPEGASVPFFNDGCIPIDDEATERRLKAYALAKRSWGCEIMYSILETVKANKVNVYLYFRYLLEEITKHLDDTDRSFLDAMLPWSAEYREYERKNSENISGLYIKGESGTKPKLPMTPRRRDWQRQ